MTQEIVSLGAAWHYRLERMLARSTFGEIWEACWLQTGATVALKRLDQSVKLPPDMERLRIESLGRELEVYRGLGECLYFARYLHAGEVDGCPVVVLELLDGDLTNRLDRQGVPLPSHEALEWIRQLAVALDWMHRHGRCHLDLKPGNLLYRELGAVIPPVLKLADFGLALDCSNGAAEHRIPGSLGWMVRIPVKLDSDSTPSWTRIPEQAGQSERSDAGFSGFTLLMSCGSSFCRAA